MCCLRLRGIKLLLPPLKSKFVEIELLKVTTLRHWTHKRALADSKVIETHNTKNLHRFRLPASNQALPRLQSLPSRKKISFKYDFASSSTWSYIGSYECTLSPHYKYFVWPSLKCFKTKVPFHQVPSLLKENRKRLRLYVIEK